MCQLIQGDGNVARPDEQQGELWGDYVNEDVQVSSTNAQVFLVCIGTQTVVHQARFPFAQSFLGCLDYGRLQRPSSDCTHACAIGPNQHFGPHLAGRRAPGLDNGSHSHGLPSTHGLGDSFVDCVHTSPPFR